MISRALAIFAVACLAGSIHLLVRDKPILLSRAPHDAAVGGLPADPSNPTANPDTGPTTHETPSMGADPYAPYSANPLFDEPVADGHVTIREAYRLFESGATFLDARHEEEFDHGHVEGAIWMPATRLSSGEGMDDATTIDPSLPVVIYCTGGDCDASENTAILLDALNLGFDIKIMGMGYDDWAAVGLPVSAGGGGSP